MDFQTGETIKDHRMENRWKVLGIIENKDFYTIFKVSDQLPEFNRSLYMMILNYDHLPGKSLAFEVSDLRYSFYHMTEILCSNYTFLPEPVDIIRFHNTKDRMDNAMRSDDPGLIFAQSSGFPLPRQTTPDQDAWKKIRSTVRSCLRTLDALHRNHVVIRSLPIHTIFLSHTTFKPYFFGFDTLIKMDEFKGYNPGKICMEPDPVYSAPECFNPRGYLSPAADIYALGKLILQIILTESEFKDFIPNDNPFPSDMQNRINSLNIPAEWSRFLSLSLNPEPEQRFQNTYEADLFFRENSSQAKPDIKRPEPKPDKPLKEAKPKKGPWKYRPNPQLPSAAMVVWGNRLTGKGENFHYLSLYHHFLYQYSFQPRLFFQFTPKPIDTDTHPFFKMLRDKFGFRIILFENRDQSDQTRILLNELVPENLKNLILAASIQCYPIQELFRHPCAGEWNISWVRAGEGHAPVPVNKLLDTSLFIRTKSSRS